MYDSSNFGNAHFFEEQIDFLCLLVLDVDWFAGTRKDCLALFRARAELATWTYCYSTAQSRAKKSIEVCQITVA